MDANTITQLFSNLGVPVACLAVTFYLCQYHSDLMTIHVIGC